MALEMPKTAKNWNARFMVNGKLRRFPLTEYRKKSETKIPIEGKRPPSLKYPERGSDALFMSSFHRAMAAHDRLKAELESPRVVQEQSARVVEAVTGSRRALAKLEDMPRLWMETRSKAPSDTYRKTSLAFLDRFLVYMNDNHPSVNVLLGVTPEMVRGFLRLELEGTENEAGKSHRTVNAIAQVLKTVFTHAEPNAPAYVDYLVTRRQLKQKTETVHRKPFNLEELKAILEAAKGSKIEGAIITAACTGLRRSDACLLSWEAVDLKAGFIRTETHKTGDLVEIPILPELRAALKDADRGGEYCWPETATLYEESPDKVNVLMRKVLKEAGFETGRGEDSTIREKSNGHRQRRGSVYGWHSFRTTFATRALAAGMTEEMVRRVTGHQSVDLVRDHYFRPDREDFRKEFEKINLTGGDAAPDLLEEMRKGLKGMRAKNWRAERDRLLDLIEDNPGK
jgi:integrase